VTDPSTVIQFSGYLLSVSDMAGSSYRTWPIQPRSTREPPTMASSPSAKRTQALPLPS
jgi:hypothetical protein